MSNENTPRPGDDTLSTDAIGEAIDESDEREAVEILREMNEREAKREREAEVQVVRKKLKRGQWLCLAIIIPCALTAWLVVPAIIGLVFVAGSWRLGKQVNALDRHGAAVLDGDGGVDMDRAHTLIGLVSLLFALFPWANVGYALWRRATWDPYPYRWA